MVILKDKFSLNLHNVIYQLHILTYKKVINSQQSVNYQMHILSYENVTTSQQLTKNNKNTQ